MRPEIDLEPETATANWGTVRFRNASESSFKVSVLHNDGQ